MKTQYLLILLLFFMTACGFHLRGSQKSVATVSARVYVVNDGANSVAAVVRSQLEDAGATSVKEAEKAEYTLRLEDETFEKTVLSVSASTGKVEQYQIALSLSITITDAQGVELLLHEPITSVNDYTFDENAVLGKFAEEKLLREELGRDVAADILRRLSDITSEEKK
jgi:LPS-assembly lipoprotein